MNMTNAEATFLNGILRIRNLTYDNVRLINKVKIFLGSKKEISYTMVNSILEITFFVSDESMLFQQISMIVKYIEKTLSINILLDDNMKRGFDRADSKLIAFQTIMDKLIALKSKTRVEETNEFIEFSNFSDSTLHCELRDYQYKAAFYLSIGQGGFDFSVPGAGKTIISYATYNHFKKHDVCTSILIIGPINSYNAWAEEYITCFGNKPDITNLASLSMKEVSNYFLSTAKNHSEITFVNIAKTSRLTKEIIGFLQNKKVLLIVDEAHKQKNPDAKITKSVLEISKYVNSRIILTGTPLPNGYEDLFSIARLFSPFKNIIPFGYGQLQKITKNGATKLQLQKIIDSIHPFYSRVSKRYLYETKQLTPPKFSLIECELSVEQRKIYDFLNGIAFNLTDDFEASINLNLMKAILIRKMQVSANPGLLSRSIINSIDEYKNEYLMEFYDEESKNEDFILADKKISELISKSDIVKYIFQFESGIIDSPKNIRAVKLAKDIVDNGEKVIIWDTFVQNMDSIKAIFKKHGNYSVEIINGSIIGSERDTALENFRFGQSMILIANPATLAESISLHRSCQNSIYVNRNYNAAQFIQSKDRIHRINMPLNKTANYYYLINQNTVDVEINNRLNLKEARMLKILDSDNIEIGGTEMENTSFLNNEDIISSYKK